MTSLRKRLMRSHRVDRSIFQANRVHMKTNLTTLILLLLTYTIGFQVHASEAAKRNPNAEIQQFEERFSSALARNDVSELQSYLSDDWRIVSGDGAVIDRARFLKVIGSGDLKHTKMSFSEPTIRIYGDTALVTSHAQSGGSYKGVDFQTDEMGTDVIVRRGGQWVCVFTQLTTITSK
jgi:ketosteroid isomerase-like protein